MRQAHSKSGKNSTSLNLLVLDPANAKIFFLVLDPANAKIFLLVLDPANAKIFLLVLDPANAKISSSQITELLNRVEYILLYSTLKLILKSKAEFYAGNLLSLCLKRLKASMWTCSLRG